ncbi:MAG: pyridoxal phosphate-dependent aminotransferase family protein [Chloroflexi bacterium]|nr:pyridoxal phosphate-dependent aminotransferase family protein [Chloroflexota bacterium]
MDLFDKCGRLTKPKEAQAAGFYPYFIPLQSEAGPEVTIDGRRLLMLGSNNYLGLTQHPDVKEAAIKAVEKYGSGCTGSRLMNGTLDLHVELEARLAQYMQKEATIVFTTGYQSNLGVISALVGRHDTVVVDRADHASIVDGCRLGLGEVVRYRHNDMEDLDRTLASVDNRHGILIVVDGVFSMEGDLVNLPEIVRLKKKHNARLLVDDAHSVGVFGEGGRGTAEHFGLQGEVDLIIATFSKSFASIGGFVAGSEEVIYYIRHSARSFLFSASLPPASAAAVLAALDIIEREPERRVRLWENTRKMKRALDELGFDTGLSESPIIPIIVGEDFRLGMFWKAAFDAGVFANAAVAPAVEPDHALLRTSYMATHTDEHLDRALDIFAAVGRDFQLIP